MPMPITVLICCANSQDTLAAACESVAWADELIIVDSGSADRTAEVAQRYATRYVVEPWRGYDKQKVFAATLARNDWVFILDGDEEVSPELAAEIQALPGEAFEKYDVMPCPRLNYVMGRAVRCWLPDAQARLVHRTRAVWRADALHDTCDPSSPERLKMLRHPILHKRVSQAAFSDYFSGRRMDERLMLVARQAHERGKRAHWWDLLCRPWLAFVKFYVFKGGFRDGAFGLMIAQKAAVSVQLKYAALWALEHGGVSPRAKPGG